jgi:filamentous hemagglutinin
VTKEPQRIEASNARITLGFVPHPNLRADETSVAALRNYYPRGGGVEFVFDPTTNTFVTGRPQSGLFQGSPHQQLAQSINASSNVVGGIFRRGPNGEILTDEHSGHYGEKWTPEIRQQFQGWLSNRVGVPVLHATWIDQ